MTAFWIILGVVFVLFTIWCWLPQRCKACGEGIYRKGLYGYTTAWITHCANCGHVPGAPLSHRQDRPLHTWEGYE